MSTNRITREDIIRLKLKKKKRIKRIWILSFACLVTVAAIVFVVAKNISSKNNRLGGQVLVGIQANIGNNIFGRTTYAELQAAKPYVPVPDSPEISAIEFIVPETTLPAVEEVEGNNWYNEELYQLVSEEPVDLNHFNNAVFIGDSRSEGLILYSGLPNLNGFCYKGLSVDKLESEANIFITGYEGEYTCYDAISMVPYSSYYCMFGINELGWNSIDVFVEDFSAMIDHIKSVNPEAIIYVESILPVSKIKSEESDIYNQERINEFNAKILEMCQTRGDVIYLDVSSAVIGEDGYLPEEASPDGVHCNADYCKRIIQYIRCNVYEKK